MLLEFESHIDLLKREINIELISEDTKLYEDKRNAFFSNLARNFKLLHEIKAKLGGFWQYSSSSLGITRSNSLDLSILEEESIVEVRRKIETIGKQLLFTASNLENSIQEADQLRIYYYHIESFDKYLHFLGIDIQHFLNEFKEKIFRKIADLRKEIEKDLEPAKVADLLMKMKFFAENLSMVEKELNEKIDECLKIYKAKVVSAGGNLLPLCINLQNTDVGCRLIQEHSCLKGEDLRKRREKMQKQDNIEYVLNSIFGVGDDIDRDGLYRRYHIFRSTYDKLLSSVLGSYDQRKQKEPNLEVLITQTKILVETRTHSANSITWDQSFIDKIPELLAHIFAIWTLKNSEHYNTSRGIEAKAYLLMPHAAQIVAIFRIFGIGYKAEHTRVMGVNVPFTGTSTDKLINNLVEIGTGEGKSVVMAVTASVFALMGVDVNCSCYSEYLSTRDEQDFSSLFQALGIAELITYGTFNKLCENLLNEQCNVREKVRDMIVNNKNMIDTVVSTIHTSRSKVLLIDEVDVFLSDKFYGGMYAPSLYLKDPLIKTLLDTLWQENKKRRLTLNIIKATPAYTACVSQYSNWTFLLEEAVKDMLAALQSYKSSTYIVSDDRIVYVEGEAMVSNVVRGYDTIWAYYHEYEQAKISTSSLEANVGIIINCGTFSYAEMPHDFAYITGVTGTLRTLSTPEKDILTKVYNVHKNTFMPSVFGENVRTYNPRNDVHAITESEYFMKIRGDIDIMCRAKRAILVFFESEEKLLAFYNSSELSDIKHDVQFITERVAIKERIIFIKRAATLGKVTLLTRTFGRGTDFICNNQQLLANGGIHVLQTFFSEELSEEYQIMGRGARQGDKGSYGMILLDRDLEWVLGSNWAEELPKINGTILYESLNEKRNKLYESKCGAKKLGIEQRKNEHKSSKEFMSALSTGNMDLVKKFLYEQNRGAILVDHSSRTVLLMDATGSMSSLLAATKETVCTMFERASIVLEEKGVSSDAFQMQCVVYRDYDCKEDGILQSSSWETKASNLRAFMSKISAKGGGDYEEAIEIGLWHAVKESEQPDGISQVILIGDAPAKNPAAIERDRKANGGEIYWGSTKFTLTHYANELQKLKAKSIKVHAFYLENGAEANFREIATETGGRCEELKIHSSNGASLLTHFVTEEILRKTAGDQGEAAVELYRAKYRKTFTS